LLNAREKNIGCVIDRKRYVAHKEVEIVQPTDFLQRQKDYNVIVVTVVNEYYNICEYLQAVGICIPMVSMAEIIYSDKEKY